MKAKQTLSKWSQFLALHGVRYKWRGTWPAIPVAIRAGESQYRKAAKEVRTISGSYEKGQIIHSNQIIAWPPDAPPAWVEKIRWKHLEEILPFKKGKSLEFFDAALYGYSYSAFERQRTERVGNHIAETDDEDQETLLNQLDAALEVCRQRVAEVMAGRNLGETADYLEGFAYGIKCQQGESRMILTRTETLKIYEVLLRYQRSVESLLQRKAKAMEICEFVAERIKMSNGMSYAEYFQKNPGRDANDRSPKETFFNNFKVYCERAGFTFQPRGRRSAKHNNF